MFNVRTFSFQNFLIAKKNMVKNVSVMMAKKKIFENVRATQSPQKPQAKEGQIHQMKLYH